MLIGKKWPEILLSDLDISVVSNLRMRVEVHDFESISLRSPPPEEEVVPVLAVHQCTQRVADVVVKGGVFQRELQLAPPV